jgi:hypothetical protein
MKMQFHYNNFQYVTFKIIYYENRNYYYSELNWTFIIYASVSFLKLAPEPEVTGKAFNVGLVALRT